MSYLSAEGQNFQAPSVLQHEVSGCCSLLIASGLTARLLHPCSDPTKMVNCSKESSEHGPNARFQLEIGAKVSETNCRTLSFALFFTSIYIFSFAFER